MNLYNEAKNKVHDRELFSYKFPHSWSKRKKINRRSIRARIKMETKKSIGEDCS